MYTTSNQFNYGLNYNTQSNKIYVNSYDDVVRYQLPPNTSFIFIDRMKPLIYDKVTDAYGGFTIKTFSITENTDDKQDSAITKNDLQGILDRLTALEKKDTPTEA